MRRRSFLWRRKRDSNPRTSYPVNGFQDRRLQPLGHLSALNKILFESHAAGSSNASFVHEGTAVFIDRRLQRRLCYFFFGGANASFTWLLMLL